MDSLLRKPLATQLDAGTVVLWEHVIALAALWAGGTVLGRFTGAALEPLDVTTLRFMFGLLGAAVVVWVTHAQVASARSAGRRAADPPR